MSVRLLRLRLRLTDTGLITTDRANDAGAFWLDPRARYEAFKYALNQPIQRRHNIAINGWFGVRISYPAIVGQNTYRPFVICAMLRIINSAVVSTPLAAIGTIWMPLYLDVKPAFQVSVICLS